MNLTKKAKILAVILIALILFGAGISIYKHMFSHTSSPSADQSYESNPTWMLGDWYSTRKQGDHLVFNKDGTFSSDWLGDGSYSVTMHQLHLLGHLNLTADLIYDESSDVLICADKQEPHRYYRTKEAMMTSIKAENEAEQTSDAALTAKKLLQMGIWEAQSGPTSHLTFTTDKVSNDEPDNLSAAVSQTYDYVIDSAEYSNQSGLIVINMTIVLNDETRTLKSGKIGLENKGDGVYVLTKYSPLWQSSGSTWYLKGGK